MKPGEPEGQVTVLTVGHSTHPLEEFLGLLAAHGVTLLADVRTVPRSRHNPQFNKETLPVVLAAAGIDYLHLQGLGGLRHPVPTRRTGVGAHRHSAATRITC